MSPEIEKLRMDRIEAALKAMEPEIAAYRAEWEAEIMEKGCWPYSQYDELKLLKPGSWVTVWDEDGAERTEQVPEAYITTYTPLGQNTDAVYPAWNRKERRARKATHR